MADDNLIMSGRPDGMTMNAPSASSSSASSVAPSASSAKRDVQRWSYLLGQRFRACFVFESCIPEGRGGEKEGEQISKQSTQNL